VLVVVVAVRGVQVSVVQIVDVVAVGDRYVAAIRSVHVFVFGVLHALVRFTGIPMIVVAVMQMSVVHVVDVVAVGDRHVAAIRSVHVWVFDLGPMIHVPSMAPVAIPGSPSGARVVSNGA